MLEYARILTPGPAALKEKAAWRGKKDVMAAEYDPARASFLENREFGLSNGGQSTKVGAGDESL
jgi:hypothetical protein